MTSNCTGCSKEMEKKLQEIIAKYRDTRGALIQVLHEAQDVYGYLPLEVQLKISEGLNIPLAEVYGVVSFYTQFTTNPKGKYRVSVCMGTACYVKGSQEILDKFKEKLGIDVGECTEDGLFSLDACRCIGACGLEFTANWCYNPLTGIRCCQSRKKGQCENEEENNVDHNYAWTVPCALYDSRIKNGEQHQRHLRRGRGCFCQNGQHEFYRPERDRDAGADCGSCTL